MRTGGCVEQPEAEYEHFMPQVNYCVDLVEGATLVKIVRIETQVVAGTKFNIELEIKLPSGETTTKKFVVVRNIKGEIISFQSVLGYGFSEECSMYLSEDDHVVCNEVYPGRYAAECEDGYYYNEATYSCDIEDTTYQCPTISDEYHMCILADGDSSLSLGCRSAWYGDDCDQLYQVHIPDPLFRGKVCNYAGYDTTADPLCDVSEFDMAGISGQFNVANKHISSFEGAQYFINLSSLVARNSDITSASAFSHLYQITLLHFDALNPDSYELNIHDVDTLFTLNRLGNLHLMGNERVYDISFTFRNIGMNWLAISNNGNVLIPLCRSETDEDYWNFITTVFPIHETSLSSAVKSFIPNSCPLNSETADYFCDSGANYKCPSIVLNEVYNSVDGVNEKQCAFIAKDSDGRCYTVHDDSVRQYLVANCLAGGSDDLEPNGIISVATMRSGLTCPSSSLSLPAIATAMSLSSVNDISTLQGLEYGTSLTSLTLDGCYTVHDDSVRQYLVANCLAGGSDDLEPNGIISVATMRSGLTCPSSSLSLPAIATAMSLSSVNDISTLQGLEYGTSLTSLTLDGYDLSGDINSNAEYDRLVVQILAKAVTYGVINSGLTSLSTNGCGLSVVSDILDLTPIADGDDLTQQFKLTHLDLSNNNISDVSVLITSPIFPVDTLASLDISGNSICDIDNVVVDLLTKFTSLTLSSLTYSDQTCHCSASVSSLSHQVCREIYPDRWAVECWNGYYLDKSTGDCVAACDSGSELDTESGTCVSVSASVDDAIRVQVCEGHSNMMPVLEEGASSITCGCRAAWYGDDCDQLYQVYIPDEVLRDTLCSLAGYNTSSDPLCDISEYELALLGTASMTTFYVPLSSLQASMPYLTPLHRLRSIAIQNNPYIYDISVFYRNIRVFSLVISDSVNYFYIPQCRSETDEEYWDFLVSVFPAHTSTDKNTKFLPNSCPLNSGGNSCTSSASCPSIVLNEVYNSVADVPAKECAFIAKPSGSGDNLTCYTVHDDNIRQYLTEHCLSETDSETNGIISVATMRSKLTCSSLSLSEVVSSSSSSVSTLDEITTLQGLEYAQGTDSNGESIGLTSLNIDGYDLSGNINENAEYDKLVVQILAKAVTYDSIDSGLTSLSASGCGLSAVSDVLDFTPRVANDTATQSFKLTSLDISYNSISDVSALITSPIFPPNNLTYLNISGNIICDIDNVAVTLQAYFTNSVIIISSDQSTCPCSGSVLFHSHKTCRQRSDGEYQVECWHGYYLDKNTNTCVKSCPSGYSLDLPNGGECVSDSGVTEDNSVHCQVCERKDNDSLISIYNNDSSSVLCGFPCESGWYGDDCSSECPISGGVVCSGNGTCNTIDHVCECDKWHDGSVCSNMISIFSPECDRAFTFQDHLECNEVYPGRYAAECEDGYYYDEADYSCIQENSSSQCPTSIDEYHMCVFADGDSAPSLGCRSAWHGNACDELYNVHIPDKAFREEICTAAEYADSDCDVTEFEMAGISGQFYIHDSHISTIQGAQNLINVYYFHADNTDITSGTPLSTLGQSSCLFVQKKSDSYASNLFDLSFLIGIHRFVSGIMTGNDRMFDISILYRNASLWYVDIANHDYPIARIPLCHLESDSDYWSFIISVFPAHCQTENYMNYYYLPNNCPLNSDPGNTPYNCDSSLYPTKCPSIVLNEVYNSVDGVNEKQCAFIAKDSDGRCYTVHDDSVRQYLVANCLAGGSDDLEPNGIISVATMRSGLTCPSSSLSLPAIATAMSLSSVNDISTLQGLEYGTSLTSLTLDGYDLSGDINSNAE
ncbi:hypothetical protein ADUPG1_013934, partial [Aduncisulcus paluster]